MSIKQSFILNLVTNKIHGYVDAVGSLGIPTLSQAGMIAALVLFVMDGLVSLSRNAMSPTEWIVGALLVGVIGIVAAFAFGGVCWLLSKIPTGRTARWASDMFAGIMIASPMINL